MDKIIDAREIYGKGFKSGTLAFWCDGCGSCHVVNDGWTFNGDYEKPTLSPSILVRGTRPLTDDEYKRVMNGEKITPDPFICHSFVKDGRIQYLGDCTHELKGQTVDLIDVKDWRD